MPGLPDQPPEAATDAAAPEYRQTVELVVRDKDFGTVLELGVIDGSAYLKITSTVDGAPAQTTIGLSPVQYSALTDYKVAEKNEFEIKLVLATVPSEINASRSTPISQGYVAIDEKRTEVRLRDKGGKYILTIKTGEGESRGEGECTLTPAQYEQIGAHVHDTISKTRHLVSAPKDHFVKEGALEVDVFHGDLSGNCVVEAEFDSLETLAAFKASAVKTLSDHGFSVRGQADFSNQDIARERAGAFARTKTIS